ncbi:MAG: sigma-54-dependent transcriptional regulator, partial [Thermoguttaceae bacterium]
AIIAAEKTDFQCVVSDLQMPGMDGIELMRKFSEKNFSAKFLLVTAHASVQTAVEAIRLGAFDYIEKPFDIENLERLVFQAIRSCRGNSRSENVTPQHDSITVSNPMRTVTVPHVTTTQPIISNGNSNMTPFGTSQDMPVMIGSSNLMKQLRIKIETVSQVSETVLIAGENGTGKEVVAKMIHAMSQRNKGAWVTLNCPALSPQLMESELFGHKKGAFTGAESDRIGRFEAAKDGTILLDEITEIDLNLQPKLLRVLQEHAFERVGASETIRSNARIIATTNRDLLAEVSQGRFREDLYYRLAVLPITVPPLRDRKEDIPELFDWFLKQTASRTGLPIPEFESGVNEILLNYDWPGNVRQLENIATRSSVFGEGDTVSTDDLRRWLSIELTANKVTATTLPETRETTGLSELSATQSLSESFCCQQFTRENDLDFKHAETTCEFVVGTSLEEVEREMIEATLAYFNGHRAKTAQTLGIGLRTLLGKLRLYGYGPREVRKCN